MPPFVYRSLKDFMRASATAQTRQELLQKLITTAAKRKAQFHVDATDARLVTSPETFGMNLSKQIMNKQSGLANIGTHLMRDLPRMVRNLPNTLERGLNRYGDLLGGVTRKNLKQQSDNAFDDLWETRRITHFLRSGDFDNVDQVLKRKPHLNMPLDDLTATYKRLGPYADELLTKADAEATLSNRTRLGTGAGVGLLGLGGLSSALGEKTSGLANIGTHLMRDLPRIMERGLNRYGDLLGGQTAKKMFPVAAVANSLKSGPQMQYRDGALEVVNQQTIKRILDAYRNEVGKVMLTRGGTAGAGALGVNELSSALGEKTSAQTINKQANMALLRQILNPALKRLQGYGANAMSAAGRGGSRYMEMLSGSKLKNLVRKHELMSQMSANVSPYDGNTMDVMRAVSGGGLQGQIQDHASNMARQYQSQALGEAGKVFGTNVATIGAAGAGGAAAGSTAYNKIKEQMQGNNQPMLAKKSMTMPQPSSRGQMKKVQMPEASPTKSDCDPEGVQMSNNKQAFMGLGALAGMATAPNKEEEDLSIGRGALRGVGTGLGVGTGAVTGGLAGGLGGAGLGAILGALARSEPRLSQRMGVGASQLGPLGMLAGGLGGAIYGGYKGNKATKALLDKSAPISEKKKTPDKEDDKEVKEAAAVVLAQLKRNHNK